MKNSKKAEIRRIFRTGNRMVKEIIKSFFDDNDLQKYSELKSEFHRWCLNVSDSEFTIMMYFKSYCNEAFKNREALENRIVAKDCITGESLTKAECDRILRTHYLTQNLMSC